jgi:hypothetical protein
LAVDRISDASDPDFHSPLTVLLELWKHGHVKPMGQMLWIDVDAGRPPRTGSARL